jgi:hypothetical protein
MEFKHIHEITLKEYRDSLNIPPYNKNASPNEQAYRANAMKKSNSEHGIAVERAVLNGVVVSDRVLADYPYLKKVMQRVQTDLSVFGDRKDIIRDENNNPLPLYRGFVRKYGVQRAARPIWFTKDKFIAKLFASMSADYEGVSHNDTEVSESYLSLKNPLVIDAEGISAGDSPEILNKWIKDAVDGGHDGLIIKDIRESGYRTDDYVVFDVSQIIEIPQISSFNPPAGQQRPGAPLPQRMNTGSIPAAGIKRDIKTLI